MVIGNSYNDVEMFKVAVLPIAIANAACFVPKSNSEDSIAYTLVRFFEEPK
jgi:hydroxymethylpyrimidine pyrophosphatase-like HAD family hydrolase